MPGTVLGTGDSAMNQSPCPMGADILVGETVGKGIKNKLMLDWAEGCEGNKRKEGEMAWGRHSRSDLDFDCKGDGSHRRLLSGWGQRLTSAPSGCVWETDWKRRVGKWEQWFRGGMMEGGPG